MPIQHPQASTRGSERARNSISTLRLVLEVQLACLLRDTRTALIIFNRNLDFTNVISEAQRAMKDHQHYKSGPTKESETRFRYVFSHSGDKQRDIIVTLMLFNMPKPVK